VDVKTSVSFKKNAVKGCMGYLALSREMEFHADEVAAHIAGSAIVKEALLGTDLSSYVYNYVLRFYENKIPEHIRSENIYREQLSIALWVIQKKMI
jgi:hypothetical protein